jgi:penicillin-binding protein 2
VNDGPRLRLAIVGIIAISLFAALVARLWYLQVLSSPELKLAAQQNQVRVVKEPAPRGRILDRNGVVIVDNAASNVVAIDRSQLHSTKERDELLARLAPLLGTSVAALQARVNDNNLSRYTPAPVAEDVDERLMVHLLEHHDEFPAVLAKQVAVRSYPFGNLAEHVVGYVGEVNDRDLAAYPGEYDLGDRIGKAGIERIYEGELRGKDGELRIEVDAQDRPIRTLDRRAPVQGNDIVLSIDVNVQRAAEAGLVQGLESARHQRFEAGPQLLAADAGSVTVLDAQEGSVVAMASYPVFDLPGLADGVSQAEAAVLFSAETGAPFINRATQGQYAPGSTWKLVTADAALRTGLIQPGFRLNDTGEFTIAECVEIRAGNRACTRRNARSHAYGPVDIQRALTVSSDVFFYNLGSKFWQERKTYGDDAIQRSAELLGFGAPTAVPLPDEASGRLASPALRQKLHEEKPTAFPEGNWFEGDNVSLAIGQGELTITPIQLANAYATYASNGVRHSPNVALRVQHQDGTLVRDIAPRVAATVELPPQVRDPIVRGLSGVVGNEQDGTAFNAFRGFPLGQWGIAGKTGTAQAPPKQDTALFVGFGPTVDPRYVVAVVMEQSGFGASAAAPVARQVFGVLSGAESVGFGGFVPLNGVSD